MLPELFIQQLKQSCDMERIVSGYLPLKKKGRYLVGLCPFHSEKSPSFYVYPQNQSFYCFGCGAGGDVITFIRRIENLEYMEAVKLLADRCGLELPMDSDQSDARSMLKKRVLEINRESARFFHSCLMSEQGRQAYEYLISRGRDRKTIRHFGLGYAPAGWDGLLNHLRAKGFSDNDMLEANVVTKGKYGPHDRFSNRVIFPIIDLRGNVVAFGGRALDDKGAKYLNSSDTPVFKKSKTLFALNFAKTSKRPGLILAEGYMDVIAIHQAGFDNAVATLGTALTEEQARLISQYAERVVLAYDSDGPGQAATKRAMNIFDEVGVKVSVLSMTGAKDPDEFIKKYGTERFAMLLDNSRNPVEFELSKLRTTYDTAQADGKVGYLKEACKLFAGIRNPVEREVYITQTANELAISPQAIKAQIENLDKRESYRQRKQQRADTNIYIGRMAAAKDDLQRRTNLRYAMAEEGVLRLLLKDESVFPEEAPLRQEEFSSPLLGRVFDRLWQLRQEGRPLSVAGLSGELSGEEMSHLTGVLQKPEATASAQRALADYIRIIREEAQKRNAQGDPLLAAQEKYKEKKGYGGKQA